ncbi:MAG: PfkB family carbohydrate kinase [Defluviitaleaceae bacterium]|nr:PfkB family carbohydrate kinase [Defluviitaleaceae bacterium]
MKHDTVVIGSAVYDITGKFLLDGVNAGDSNPSSIYTSCGGVGRNIAENTARIGLATSLITAWGTDAFSTELRASCENVGVDVSRVYSIEGSKTSVYIDLLDRRGELVMAAADLTALESLPAAAFSDRLEHINRHSLVCLDANLTEQQLTIIAEGCRKPIMGDTVSVAKAPRFRNILNNMHTLKTNAAELSALTCRTTDDRDGIEKAASELLAAGLERVFVTRGEQGSCCIDRQGAIWLDKIAVRVTSATGAGDAFAAGVAYGMLRVMSAADTLIFGTAMSHIALQSPSAVSNEVTEAMALSLHSDLKKSIDINVT